MPIRSSCAALIGAAGLMAAQQATAQTSPADAHWSCWYNNDSTVRCILEQPAADSDLAEREVKIMRPAPGARELPPLVREIVRAPRRLVGAEVSIPLLSPPDDLLFVEQLAQSTMCYGRPACRVTFLRPSTEVAMLR